MPQCINAEESWEIRLGWWAYHTNGLHHEADRTTRNKNGCAREDIFLYYVGNFNVDFKCFYTIDYIATLFRSPINALHLAVHAIQCKVVFAYELVC